MGAKWDAMLELFRRLGERPPARTRKEAHGMIVQELDAIETKRRGKRYSDDLNAIGQAGPEGRMVVPALDDDLWELEGGFVAWRANGGVVVALHEDGSILITHQKNAEDQPEPIFSKPGASQYCESGHWLTDRFDLDHVDGADSHYVALAYHAAISYGSILGCEHCEHVASGLGRKFPHLAPL